MIGIAGFALALLIVFMSIMRGPGNAGAPAVPDNTPRASVDPLAIKFIDDVKASGQRPPRMLEPRASSLLRQVTDRTRLHEISNPVRIKSACMSAEAVLGLYRRPKNPTDKPLPPITGPNGVFGPFDPYFLEETGLLAGFIVRCLGAQVVAMERAIDVIGANPIEARMRDEVRLLRASTVATLENLFASPIPDGNAPDYRTYSQFADAVMEYSIVFMRALSPQEREKLLDKAAKFVEKTPPFMRDSSLRMARTLTSTECTKMCKLK